MIVTRQEVRPLNEGMLQDQWTQTSRMSMNDARSAFQVVKLSSGKVLAVGGMGRDSSVLSSSELFDPSTQMWTKQGQLTNGRAYFSLVLMSDGRVLAAGGIGNTGAILNTSEVNCSELDRFVCAIVKTSYSWSPFTK